MIEWKELDSECCPDCGNDLHVRTSAIDGQFYDSDEVRCVECSYYSAISVDEDGSSWLQEGGG